MADNSNNNEEDSCQLPQWWMDIAPHHTLDLEEDEARRRAEAQMRFYYSLLAEAEDEGMLDAQGRPSAAWLQTRASNWSSSSNSNSSGGRNGSATGRNFKINGGAVVDPKMFGIYEDHPDYQAYLTGAKLPPGYFEKMGEIACMQNPTEHMANNLRQTDFGRYGRQAEQPQHKPAWAKLKLRSTAHGQAVRKGDYISSPERLRKSAMEAGEEQKASMSMPSLDDNPTGTTEIPAPSVPAPDPTPEVTTPIEEKSVKPSATITGETAAPVVVSAPAKGKKLVRKVRMVKRKPASTPGVTSTSPPEAAPTTMPATAPSSRSESKPAPYVPQTYDKYKFSDYYYNAKDHTDPSNITSSGPEPTPRSPGTGLKPKWGGRASAASTSTGAPTSPGTNSTNRKWGAVAPPASPTTAKKWGAAAASTTVPPSPTAKKWGKPVAATPSPPASPLVSTPQPEYYGDDEGVEEEVIYDDDDEYYEDEEYDEEEILEDEVVEGGETADIQDLQAILRAKQAELMRLQAQLM